MRFSLESRVPFLTTGLVDLALSLPESFHVNSSQVSKAVFRAAMRGIVPDVILDRKDKIGFETPDAAWSQKMRDYLVEQLQNSISSIISEHIDSAKLLTKIHSRPNDFAKFEIWRLLNFVKWAERYRIT
jgi:asparagine synthase (glutamine-hydrolysing)